MDDTSFGLDNVRLISDNATFGLYSAATGIQSNGNLLVSPLSILYASILLYTGSRGGTKADIESALNLDKFFQGDRDNVTRAFSNTLRQLKVTVPKPSSGMGSSNSQSSEVMAWEPAFQLALANAVFVEKTFNISQNYLSDVTQYLKASVAAESFLQNPEDARQDINKWVDERTGGKIKNLIPAGGVDASTVAALVNAVYFKSSWLTKFTAADTKPDDFHLLSGSTVKTNFMHMSKAFNYAENKDLGFQYLEIPYTDFEASLLVFLPRKLDGLRQLEKALTPDLLRNLSAQADDSRLIQLSLPKFKTESSFDLVSLMMKIGVSKVFTSNADLSGISGSPGLQVSQAFHKTFIDLDEKGTEAAAASGFMVSFKSAMFDFDPPGAPIVFQADHPFIYAIRHNPTKLIVFIGRQETF